jgi:hypothetical protein
LEDGTGAAAAACYSLCIAGFQLKHLSPSSVGHPKENVNHLLHLVGSDVVLPCANISLSSKNACQTFYSTKKRTKKKESVFLKANISLSSINGGKLCYA